MKAIHISDVHFEFLSQKQKMEFISRMIDEKPRLILSTGDLDSSGRFFETLTMIDRMITPHQILFMFVNGNHEYYGDSILRLDWELKSDMRGKFNSIRCLDYDNLFAFGGFDWIVGSKGWYDFSQEPKIEINDFVEIYEMQDPRTRKSFSQMLAGESTAKIIRAINNKNRMQNSGMIVLTHVPPISTGGEEGLFYNDSLRRGLEFISKYPIDVTVLCGHTHTEIDKKIGNIRIHSMGALYERPVYQILELELANNGTTLRNVEFGQVVVPYIGEK